MRAGRGPGEAGAAAPAPLSGIPTESRPALLEIVRPGLATSVQDGGRTGLGRFGVSPSGPMDPLAHRLANQLVGNDGGAAALEVTGPGCELLFLREVRFAIAGADLEAALDGQPLAPPLVATAPAGARLQFRQRRRGARAALAVAGGLEAPLVLGSVSTDLGAGLGGIGGRPLRAGQRLAGGDPTRPPAGDPPAPPPADPRDPPPGDPPGPPENPPRPPAGDPPPTRRPDDPPPAPAGDPSLPATPPAGDALPPATPPAGDALPPATPLAGDPLPPATPPAGDPGPAVPGDPAVLRFVPEHDAGVPSEAADAFARLTFRVSPRSNRTGFRFEGEPLPAHPDPERLSEPTAPGAIQLPPDGLPILLMADRNTIGGYPILGHLATADRPRAAQLWPGDLVRFHPISLGEAAQLCRDLEAILQAAIDSGRPS